MALNIGDTLPTATFRTVTPDGVKEVTTADVFGGKTVVLFGVPGAFTPTCHKTHLPGYVKNYEAITAKGVDTIACVAVNDQFVLDAWAEQGGAKGKVLMLADGNGDFTKAADMVLDGSGFGLGLRSKRYAAVVEDGVVKEIKVEDNAGQVSVSGAETICKL